MIHLPSVQLLRPSPTSTAYLLQKIVIKTANICAAKTKMKKGVTSENFNFKSLIFNLYKAGVLLLMATLVVNSFIIDLINKHAFLIPVCG